MSLTVFPIEEKYVSITPPLSYEENTLVDGIKNALSVIASNSTSHYSAASSLQQKMSRILCDWDLNYAENKSVLTELWHFFHSIEKKHIEFCDKRGCPTQCDCHSVSSDKRIRLDTWWGAFKMLVKTIDDRIDNNILICVKPRIVRGMDDHIYYVLTDLYLNIENTKYEAIFNDIFYRLIMENEKGLKNSPATFRQIVELLQMIRVDDFKFVGTRIRDTCEECVAVDFYEWWSKFTVFKRQMETTYKKIESGSVVL